MLNKIKKYYKRPHKLIYLALTILLIRIRYFSFIMIHRLKRKNIDLDKSVIFSQKVIVAGKGYLKIGRSTIFGVKNGGGFKYGTIEIQPRTPESRIIIGENVSMNNGAFICAANNIEIKDNVLIGRNLNIMDFEAHGTLPSRRKEMGSVGEVVIGENVWIGNNVTILKNVYIGNNSIVATGSVVLKGKYPPSCILGGNPAKVIKEINESNSLEEIKH